MGVKPAHQSEVVVVAKQLQHVEGHERNDEKDEEPLDPRETDINRRPLRKIDAEAHEAERHGGLRDDGPDDDDGHQWAKERGWGDEESVEIAQDAQDQPGVWVAGFRQNDVEACEEAEGG